MSRGQKRYDTCPLGDRQTGLTEIIRYSHAWMVITFTFTALKRSLGQGNIFRSVCHEFCPRGGGSASVHAGIPPPRPGTPPGPGTPPNQTPPRPGTPQEQDPPGPGTPPRSRTPQTRHPPGSRPPCPVHAGRYGQ